MRTVARTALSALLASVIPALPFAFISLLTKGDKASLVVALIAWSISLAHVVVLGIPAFFLLRHTGLASRWSVMLAGFALGFVPMMVSLVTRGGAGLLGAFVFGVLGAFSAWVFWVAWCRLGPNNSFKPKPLRGSA